MPHVENGAASTEATTEGGVLPDAPLVQSPTARGHRGADGGTTTMAAEISQWCKQIKREKETKTKVIWPLTPPATGPRARNYHRIVAEGGGGMDRGIAASLELAIKKRKTLISQNK